MGKIDLHVWGKNLLLQPQSKLHATLIIHNMDRIVFRAFKKKGLSLTADASRAIGKVLTADDAPEDFESSLDRLLDEIKDRIEKKEIKSSVIDLDTVSLVVASLSSSEEDLEQQSTELFDAFASPKLVYDERAKTYKVDPNPPFKLHGSVESRARMFRERLLHTQQRLLRSGMFVTRTMGQGINDSAVLVRKGHELSTIENLLGSVGSKVLLGMITQVREE